MTELLCKTTQAAVSFMLTLLGLRHMVIGAILSRRFKISNLKTIQQ